MLLYFGIENRKVFLNIYYTQSFRIKLYFALAYLVSAVKIDNSNSINFVSYFANLTT